MLIDWFTVIAQIINFLILLFLLHRFLYKPILKTVDKRKDQMEARWHAAEEEKQTAHAEAEKHRKAQRELEAQREHILSEAKAKADEIHRSELRQAREEIAQKREQWQRALENEQSSIMANLQAEFGQQIVAVLQRILHDIANRDLEQQAVKTFQQKLHELDDETRQAIAEAFAHHDQPVTIQSGHDLPESDQDALRQTLHETNLLNGQPIHFDVSPDLLFGIRLQNPAYNLAWNAEDVFDALLDEGAPVRAFRERDTRYPRLSDGGGCDEYRREHQQNPDQARPIHVLE